MYPGAFFFPSLSGSSAGTSDRQTAALTLQKQQSLPPPARTGWGTPQHLLGCFRKTGSVTIAVIQILALCPNSEGWIRVMTLAASTVMVVATEAGIPLAGPAAPAEATSVYPGAVNIFGCQLSKKNPIVGAAGGIAGGGASKTSPVIKIFHVSKNYTPNPLPYTTLNAGTVIWRSTCQRRCISFRSVTIQWAARGRRRSGPIDIDLTRKITVIENSLR